MRRLLAANISFYGPCAASKSRSPSGRVRTSWLPLFSNYVFLFGNHDDVANARKTNCLSSVIEVADGDRLVSDLRDLNRLIGSNAPIQVEQKLAPGDRVRVKVGSFAGCEGIVTKRRGRHYLVVNISFIQQSVLVELDDFLVEAI